MVPMAPSSTTMRWAKRSRSARTREACAESVLIKLFVRGFLSARTHAERVADGVRELAAVQRVEMELVDDVPLQRVHLLDGHGGRDELARVGVVVEPVEAVLEPLWDGRPAAF